ncbi:MAG TPA: glycosyltransferase [Gemmatimonadaceae bacterium]
MRVLHVIGSVAPREGGPTVAIKGMSSALAAQGLEVTVATTNADGPRDTLDVPVRDPVIEKGVEYRHFARTLPGTFGLSLPLSRWLRANVAAYDVVEVHGLFVHATIAGCRAARRAGVPYVVRPLGMLDPWSLAQHAWKKRPYIRLIERPHLDGAAAIHATSESEADSVRGLGYRDRVRVIPLGVDAMPASRSERRGGDAIELLFLSRLHPKKNVPLLLAAVAEARKAGADLRLTIAGTGTDEYRAELDRQVDALALRPVVRFVGQVAGDAKRELLARSDVFALPSSQENFGIAVAEALAAGLPVVVSDQVALAPDIAAADAGIIVPVDVAATAAALIDLARDPERRRAMGDRAARLAEARYSWARTARELRELYEELARARRVR